MMHGARPFPSEENDNLQTLRFSEPGPLCAHRTASQSAINGTGRHLLQQCLARCPGSAMLVADGAIASEQIRTHRLGSSVWFRSPGAIAGTEQKHRRE
jgi:hypothetical protein